MINYSSRMSTVNLYHNSPVLVNYIDPAFVIVDVRVDNSRLFERVKLLSPIYFKG